MALFTAQVAVRTVNGILSLDTTLQRVVFCTFNADASRAHRAALA